MKQRLRVMFIGFLITLLLYIISMWAADTQNTAYVDHNENLKIHENTEVSDSEIIQPTIVTERLLDRHKHDAERFAEQYTGVLKDNSFIMASFEEVQDLLERGSGILAFGFPFNTSCQNAFPVLERAFREMGMDQRQGYHAKIFYYDILDDYYENNEHYQILLEHTKEFLKTDDDGNLSIVVPNVFFISSGKIVGSHTDTVESVMNPQDPLNEEQEAELLEIYKKFIQIMNDACNVC